MFSPDFSLLPRRRISATLSGSVSAVTLLACLSPVAHADPSACIATGDVTLFDCSTDVTVRVESGDTTLTIDGIALGDGNINYNPNALAAGPIDMKLSVSNTTVNSTDYGGINIYSAVGGTSVSVDLDDTVSVTSAAGFGGLWVRNEVSGDIRIESAAGIESSSGDGVTATTNGGGVVIENSGSVLSTVGRGLYADGGYSDQIPVEVTVTNTSIVNGFEAGIRAINYNGTAQIGNSGIVSSETKQGLIAWSPLGDVLISNESSGIILSNMGIAIEGATQTGDLTVTNHGDAAGVSGIRAVAGFNPAQTGAGDISITNTGDLEALNGTGIYARTPKGDVTLINSGEVESSGVAISADTSSGTVHITNTGILSGATGIQTGDADTRIVNSGHIEGQDGGRAIEMGTGDVTLELHAGSIISGYVEDADAAGSNTLVLGGASDATFDAGAIGDTATFRGFHTYLKTGESNWTLTGTGSTGWTISEGTLTAGAAGALGEDQAFVITGGTLDLNGLSATLSSLTGTTDGRVETGGGRLTIRQDGDIGYAGSFTGGGVLTKTGAGSLTLSGDNSAFDGTLTVAGGELVIDGQTTDATLLFLGAIGGTSLTVQNEGVLNVANGIVGNSTNNGGMAGIEDESGQLSVTGPGSELNSDFLTVGYYGDGKLTLSDGASATVSASLSLGTFAGVTGILDISGEGSSLRGGALMVGSSGAGELSLSGAATLETKSGGFGINAGSTGIGELSGAETRWAITQNSLTLGSAGRGDLTVSGGATIDVQDRVTLGLLASGEGVLTLEGPGSSVSAATDFIIGSSGQGAAAVSSGATLEGERVVLGLSDGGRGTLRLDGAGSLVRGGSYVMLGTYAGSAGEVTVANGATLQADGNRGITLAYGAGASGTLNIGAGAGEAAAAAGFIDAGSGIQFGAGEGRLVLNHTDAAYELAAGLSGVGAVDVLAGMTVFAGNSENFSGALTISGGTAVMAGAASAASVKVGADGTLQIGNGGSGGALNSDILNAGTLRFDRSDALSHHRIIAGSGNVSVAGGHITLSGMNTFTGETRIDAGATLALSGQGRVNQSEQVIVNGIFDVTAASSAQIRDLSGDGTIVLGSAGLIVHDASQTFSGQITGSGGLFLTGGGLTLTGESDFSGGLGISQGASLTIGDGGSYGSVAANITNYGELNFNRSDEGVFSGIITGPGVVRNTGSGVLSLTGDVNSDLMEINTGAVKLTGSLRGNVYIGSQGLLQVGDGTTDGRLRADMVNNGQVVFSQSGNGVYAGGMGGTGSVRKLGFGRLELTGVSALDGNTYLDEGGLSINGVFGTNLLTVANGAALYGSGAVHGDVVVLQGGILSPGNSPGTLFVSGDVTLNPGSIFDTELDGRIYAAAGGAGSYDRVVLTGEGATFTAAGSINPILRGITGAANNDFNPAIGDRFTVVVADNIAGRFDSVEQPSDGLPANTRFRVIYGQNSIQLALVARSLGLMAQDSGLLTNASAAGFAIDAATAYGDQATGALSRLYTDLDSMTQAQVGAALASLGGDFHAHILESTESILAGSDDMILSAALGGKGIGGIDRELNNGIRVWSRAEARGASYDADRAGIGFEEDVYGFTLGATLINQERLRAGLAASYKTVELYNDTAAGATNQMFSGYAYGSYTVTPRLTLSGLAGYTQATPKTVRTTALSSVIAQTKSEEKLDVSHAQAEARYKLLSTGATSVYALGGLRATILNVDAYSERGNVSYADLSLIGESRKTLQTKLGAEVARTLAGTDLAVFGNWARDIGDDPTVERTASLGNAFWQVQSVDRGLDTYNYGFSARREITGRVGVELAYTGRYNSPNYDAQQLMVGVNVAW